MNRSSNYENKKLPLEYTLKEALGIYIGRLAVFFIVGILSFALFGSALFIAIFLSQPFLAPVLVLALLILGIYYYRHVQQAVYALQSTVEQVIMGSGHEHNVDVDLKFSPVTGEVPFSSKNLYPILDEQAFARALRFERRRTDRSGRPFLLLLLEFSPLPQEGRKRQRSFVHSITQSLEVCTRQTDITGWYKTNAVLGVIFTELDQGNLVIGRMLEKVQVVLQTHLTPEQIDAITVSAHVYPHHDSGRAGLRDNHKLYPSLTQKEPARLLKRMIDLLGSFCLLVLLIPLFSLIGAAIKFTSKGPILFKQTRIGQFGEPFTFLKFRSMYTDADSKAHEKYIKDFIRWGSQGNDTPDPLKRDGFFRLTGDPRVTPVGAFLRRTSMDELPQLINVFLGDMTLVGPRPPIAYEVEHYETWHMRRVLEAKPGITGLYQVKGRSRTTFDDMVRLDLKYIDESSLWTDIKILLQTPWVVLSGIHSERLVASSRSSAKNLYPILDEQAFARALRFERRRTDRSGRPFLLLLLEFSPLPQEGRKRQRSFVHSITQSLEVCTRQTDITGWYKTNAVLGVIFTELDQGNLVIGRMLEKVQVVLQTHLTPEQIDAITVSAHVYPHHDSGRAGLRDNPKLYPSKKRVRNFNFLINLLKNKED